MASHVENVANDWDGTTGWGTSLRVRSVQELVRSNSDSIPERYIQNHPNRPCLSESFSDIPVIKLSLLAGGDQDERRKLDSACKEYGFFQIIDHGIKDEVLYNVKASVAAFFDLPLSEKMKYAMRDGLQGYGQAYVVSEQQKLDWNDLLFLMTIPSYHKNLKYWPTELLPHFKEAIEKYSEELQKVTDEIFGNLSSLLGLERNCLRDLHGVMKQGMRLNYYPKCHRPEMVLGVSPHSDSSSITLLLQDDLITGLQINHNGRWIPVTPIPNAIVVNIGDALEAWSNGVYRSVEHRAVTNERRARMSVATFVIPDDEVEIGPLKPVLEKCAAKLYKDVKYVDYLRHTLSRNMDGKTNLQFLKVQEE